MVGKVLFGAVTCIYAMVMIALLFFSEDNLSVIWYNNVTDLDGSEIVVSTFHDTTLEDFIQSACMVTLTVLIFSVLTLKQIYESRNTDLARLTMRQSNTHYLVMFIIWVLLSMMIFGSLFNYIPDKMTPYQKSYFQPYGRSCDFYYIQNSSLYSDDVCYTILPKLNISHSYVCCLDIQPVKFVVNFSYSSMLQVICIGLYPLWLFISYFVIASEHRSDGYVRLN